jgi:hypothetical protein
VFVNRFEQGHALVAVARLQRMRQAHGAALDGVFEVAHDEALAHLGDALVAELDHLGKVVAGVDVQQRKRQLAGEAAVTGAALERLLGQAQYDARIFAAGEQQRGPLESGGDFAQDEDRLFFQPVEVAAVELRQQTVEIDAGVHAEAP